MVTRNKIIKLKQNRRHFLQILTTSMSAIGAGLAVWPFIDSMNPSADVLAVGMKEVNLDIVSRDKTGKSNCKQLRNMGKIPAVIYGDKKEPTYIAVDYPKIVKELSLKPICEDLKDKLNENIRLVSKNIKEVKSTDLFNEQDEKIAILENIRFYEEEEKNDDLFSKKISVFQRDK